MIHRATLVRVAPIDVTAPRPDGPLVRDLAAWVRLTRYVAGAEFGPLPIVGITAWAALDAVAADTVAAINAEAGRTVLIYITDSGRIPDDIVVNLATVTPA